MQPQFETRFEDFYRAHVAQILGYFRRRLPHAMASDATAEVFIVVWRRFEERPPDERTLPWLFGIANNVRRNIQRAERRRSRLHARLVAADVPTRLSVAADATSLRSAERQEVMQALERLSDRDQEILRLVEWDGLDRAAVGAMFGISRGGVDKRISRAYAKIRRHLQPYPDRNHQTALAPEAEL